MFLNLSLKNVPSKKNPLPFVMNTGTSEWTPKAGDSQTSGRRTGYESSQGIMIRWDCEVVNPQVNSDLHSTPYLSETDRHAINAKILADNIAWGTTSANSLCATPLVRILYVLHSSTPAVKEHLDARSKERDEWIETNRWWCRAGIVVISLATIDRKRFPQWFPTHQ